MLATALKLLWSRVIVSMSDIAATPRPWSDNWASHKQTRRLYGIYTVCWNTLWAHVPSRSSSAVGSCLVPSLFFNRWETPGTSLLFLALCDTVYRPGSGCYWDLHVCPLFQDKTVKDLWNPTIHGSPSRVGFQSVSCQLSVSLSVYQSVCVCLSPISDMPPVIRMLLCIAIWCKKFNWLERQSATYLTV